MGGEAYKSRLVRILRSDFRITCPWAGDPADVISMNRVSWVSFVVLKWEKGTRLSIPHILANRLLSSTQRGHPLLHKSKATKDYGPSLTKNPPLKMQVYPSAYRRVFPTLFLCFVPLYTPASSTRGHGAVRSSRTVSRDTLSP